MMSSPSRRAFCSRRCSLAAGSIGSFMSGLISIVLSGFIQALVHQFQQILDGQCSMIQHRFVIAAEVELIAQLALDLLPQAVEGRAAYKVGRKLARTLLRPDDLEERLAIGLKRASR